MRFPLDDVLVVNFEKWFHLLKQWFGVAIYFCFIILKKGKQNKKKKTLNVTPYFGKSGLWKKSDQARGLGYLSGRYGKDRDTPLSP